MIRATEGTFVAGLGSVIGHFRDSTLDGRILELIEDIVRYCDWMEDVTPDAVDTALSPLWYNGVDFVPGETQCPSRQVH